MPLPQATRHTAVISVLLAVVITGGLFEWEQRQKNISEELSLTAAHGTSFKPAGCNPACTAATINAASNPMVCAKWCNHNCEAFPQYCNDGNPCTNDSCSSTNEFVCAPSTAKCSGALSACLPDGTCVQCTTNAHCTQPGQICDQTSHNCVVPKDVAIEWFLAPYSSFQDGGQSVGANVSVKNTSNANPAPNIILQVMSPGRDVSLFNSFPECNKFLSTNFYVECNFTNFSPSEEKIVSVVVADPVSASCTAQTATMEAKILSDSNSSNNNRSTTIDITCPPDIEAKITRGSIALVQGKISNDVDITLKELNGVNAEGTTVSLTMPGIKVVQANVPRQNLSGCEVVGGNLQCSSFTFFGGLSETITMKIETKSDFVCTAPTTTVKMNLSASTTSEKNIANNTDSTDVVVTCKCGNGTKDAGEQCDKTTDYTCTDTCTCEPKFKPGTASDLVCVFECPAGDQAAIDQFCNDTCASFGADKTACVTDCKRVCKPTSSSSSSSYSGGSSSQGGAEGGAEGGAQGGDIGGPGGGDLGGAGGEQGGAGGTDGGAGGAEGGAGGATGGGGGSSSRASSLSSSRASSLSSSSLSSSSRSSSASSSRTSSVSSSTTSRSSSSSGSSEISSSLGSASSGSSGGSSASGGSSTSSSINNVCELGCLAGGTEFCAAQSKTCVPTLAFPCLVCVGSSSSSSASGGSSRSSSVKSVSSSSSARSFSSFAFFSSARFCGNTILEPGEECEASQVPSGSDFICISCRIVFNVSCGDGRLDSGEECDDGDGDDGDGCSSTCDIEFATFNPSSTSTPTLISELPSSRPTLILPPHVCGDGTQELGETCDDGNNVSGDGCSASCKLEEQLIPGRCGDGLITLGEECDDGNSRDFDGCTAQCKLEVGRCGDGVLQTLLGEQCEPVLHDTSNGSQCGADCRLILTTCGDAKVDAGEECDEGAANHSDTLPDRCRTNCSNARCGDRVLDSVEQCDDGNRLGFDGCDRFCRREAGAPTTDVAANIIELPSLPFPPFTSKPPTASLTPIVQSHAPAGETGPAALAVMAAGAAAGYSWMRRKIRKK